MNNRDGPRQEPDQGGSSGLFLLSGVLLALAVLMGMAREQNWGQKRFGLKIRTTDAEGLRAGMEVRIAGLPVGKVASLNLDADAKVAINLEIQERYRHLVGPRSRAAQGQDGIVGDQYIAITADTDRDLPLRPRPVDLPYEPPVTMRELIAGWEQTRGSLQRTLDHAGLLAGRDVPRTLAEMRQSLAAATRLSGRVQQETAATGPAIRRTLGQVDRAAVAARATATAAGETATSARRAADEASLVLGSSRPLLLKILHDLQAVSGRTERLLRSLLGSEALAPAADDGGGGSPVNGAPR